MAENTNFEEFVREFFMYATLSRSERKKLYLGRPLISDGMKVLDYFSESHLQFFRPVFLKIQYEDLQTDEQLLKLTVPRCLNLIDIESYFYSFMLVACYLREFVNFIKDSRLCCRFHLTVYKCFLAVFNRTFVYKFETYGGLEGLGDYLKEVKYDVYKTKYTNILKTLTENKYRHKLVIRVIRNCNNVLDVFTMNNYERLLIIDDKEQDILKKFADDHGPDILFFKWPPLKKDVKLKVTSFLKGLNEYSAHKTLLAPSDGSTGSRNVSDGGMESNSLRSTLLRYTRLLLSKNFGGSGSGKTSYDYLCSDLSLYTSLLVSDAEKELSGSELTEFREAMKQRMCPSCGMKCYQLSRMLFK